MSGRQRRIDWFYARPGCESCEKVRAELAARRLTIVEERSTKRPLTEAEAIALLGEVDRVRIARGGKIDRRAAPETVPGDLRGPTGGFRAPLLRRGRELLVGYSAAALADFLREAGA